MKKQPNPEQMRALVRYARENGRDWKRKLNDAWLRAAEPGLLHEVRNEFGPRWLASFKFPVETESAMEVAAENSRRIRALDEEDARKEDEKRERARAAMAERERLANLAPATEEEMARDAAFYEKEMRTDAKISLLRALETRTFGRDEGDDETEAEKRARRARVVSKRVKVDFRVTFEGEDKDVAANVETALAMLAARGLEYDEDFEPLYGAGWKLVGVSVKPSAYDALAYVVGEMVS